MVSKELLTLVSLKPLYEEERKEIPQLATKTSKRLLILGRDMVEGLWQVTEMVSDEETEVDRNPIRSRSVKYSLVIVFAGEFDVESFVSEHFLGKLVSKASLNFQRNQATLELKLLDNSDIEKLKLTLPHNSKIRKVKYHDYY